MGPVGRLAWIGRGGVVRAGDPLRMGGGQGAVGGDAVGHEVEPEAQASGGGEAGHVGQPDVGRSGAEGGVQAVMVGGDETVTAAAGHEGRRQQHMAEIHGGDAGELRRPVRPGAEQRGVQIIEPGRRGGGRGVGGRRGWRAGGDGHGGYSVTTRRLRAQRVWVPRDGRQGQAARASCSAGCSARALPRWVWTSSSTKPSLATIAGDSTKG